MSEIKNKSILLALVAERSQIPAESLYFVDKKTVGITRNVFVLLPERVEEFMLEDNTREKISHMKQMVKFITSPHTSFRDEAMLPYIELALSNMMDIGVGFRRQGLSLPSFILPDEVALITPGMLVNNNRLLDEFGINLRYRTYFPPSYEGLPIRQDSMAKQAKMMNFVLQSPGGKPHPFTAKFLIQQ